MTVRLLAIVMIIFWLAIYSSITKAADLLITWESDYTPDSWTLYHTVNTIEQPPITVEGIARQHIISDVESGIHVVTADGVVGDERSETASPDSAFILEFTITVQAQ